jgi:hypothetical protein
MPEDHFNEKPLGPGNYTYTIDFGGSSDSTAFILELSKD